MSHHSYKMKCNGCFKPVRFGTLVCRECIQRIIGEGMSNEPEPEHGKSEPETANGTDANEHWDWGRADAGDE